MSLPAESPNRIELRLKCSGISIWVCLSNILSVMLRKCEVSGNSNVSNAEPILQLQQGIRTTTSIDSSTGILLYTLDTSIASNSR
jgi:hypothetical protein